MTRFDANADDLAERVRSIEERLASGDEKFTTLIRQIENLVSQQTQQTEAIRHVAELLTAWNNAKGFIITIQVIGKTILWCSVVGSACFALWYYLRNGTWYPR